MSGDGTAATTLITTRGLWIDDGITSALEFGAGLTPWFRLWTTYTANPYVAAAGSYPLAPGEIQNLYKEVAPEQQYYVIPRDQEAKYFQRTFTTTLKIKFAGKDIEKTFVMSENRARLAFKVINLMNGTKNRVHVSVNAFKRITSKGLFKVRNLKLARKSDK